MVLHDLTGTIGLAFYWWGADNPPSALVQVILETPTGFWYSDFYDGPARYRYVLIPWGKFIWASRPQRLLEPHHHGFEEPSKSQISGFIWIVHTSGVRRLDYVHAPKQLPGPKGVFIARHSESQEWPVTFIVRHSDSYDVPAEMVIRRSASLEFPAGFRIRQETFDLPASFEVRQGQGDIPAQFISRQVDSQNLAAAFTVIHDGSEDLPAALRTPEGFMVGIREHKIYAAWNPNWVYTKATSSILRGTTNDPALGRSHFVVNVSRAWIQGKYVRITWQGNYDAGAGSWGTRVVIYDGSYNVGSDVDFPSGSGPLIKGNGLLQTGLTKSGSFGMQTNEFQVDVSGGSEDMVSIMVYSNDSWNTFEGWYQVEALEINTGAGGAGTLYREKFDAAIVMERTGTTGDYGYISDGDLPIVGSGNVKAGFTVRQGTEDLKAELVSRKANSRELKAGFDIAP